jgi:hypothetical protein
VAAVRTYEYLTLSTRATTKAGHISKLTECGTRHVAYVLGNWIVRLNDETKTFC